MVWKKEYRTDSGGAGTYRGGTGQIMEIASSEEAPFAICATFDRVHNPPRGRAGGGDGKTGKLFLASGATLKGKGTQAIPSGDKLMLEMPGGAGYGDPLIRDAAAVALDVRDGLVSGDAAEADYGVVLAADGSVDQAATESLRAKMAGGG